MSRFHILNYIGSADTLEK